MQLFSGGEKKPWADNKWLFPKHVNKRALTCRQPDTGDLMVTPAATWQLCAITGPDAMTSRGIHNLWYRLL